MSALQAITNLSLNSPASHEAGLNGNQHRAHSRWLQQLFAAEAVSLAATQHSLTGAQQSEPLEQQSPVFWLVALTQHSLTGSQQSAPA
jgi:hypothetical protein